MAPPPADGALEAACGPENKCVYLKIKISLINHVCLKNNILVF